MLIRLMIGLGDDIPVTGEGSKDRGWFPVPFGAGERRRPRYDTFGAVAGRRI